MAKEYKGCTTVTAWRSMGYVMRGFSVSKVTILKWMRRLGMPHIRIEGEKRDNVRFDLTKVLPWGKEKGKVWHEPQTRQKLEEVHATS